MDQSVNLSKNLLRKIAVQFGTPLYIYDSEIIKKNYFLLKDGLASLVDIFYSIKANPNIAVSSVLNKLGAGVEVCSGTELEMALLAGFQPENIIFVGPAKKTVDIVRALELKIYAIVCESKEELSVINELAKTRSVVANVAIRINPGFVVRDASLKMGGVPSQFGMDQQEVLQNKNFFLRLSNINLMGIHVFNGTRILQAETFVENTKNILKLAEELENEWNVRFSMLDIGGGIGVPYFRNETGFDLTKLASLNFPFLQEYKRNHSNTRIILESGRYLVAESGLFLSQINNVKKSRGKFFLITDGGMNCHFTAAGYGSVLGRNFPVTLLTASVAKKTNYYHVTGPLCTPADFMARDVLLPEAKCGDFVVIKASGAYGPTASPVLFLGHGHPAEVLVEEKVPRIVRERDIADDFIRKQVV